MLCLGSISDSNQIDDKHLSLSEIISNDNLQLPDSQQNSIKRSIMLGLGSGFTQSFSFTSNIERPSRPIDPNIKRPKVLCRRRGSKTSSTSPIDWGEQCVDMFEVINQIGEGTYGQVYKAKNKTTGMNIII